MLDADDVLTFVHDDRVPDRHVLSRQVQLVGTGQRVVIGEGIRQSRYRLFQQVEDHALDGPSQRPRQGFYLLPGRSGEADEAITH
jgi:hypothetical protein